MRTISPTRLASLRATARAARWPLPPVATPTRTSCMCGVMDNRDDAIGGWTCTMPAGHSGAHANDGMEWQS